MKTVKDLNPNETMLTTVRKVAGGMFQIEIAEVVVNPSARQNILADLHEGDKRFDVGRQKARRGWITANPASLLSNFGIDVTKLTFAVSEGREIAEVNISNPTIKGNRLVLQIEDGFKPSWDGQEPKQTVNGQKEKLVFFKGDKPLYSNTRIVAEQDRKHSIIESDSRKPYAEYEEYLTGLNATATTVGADMAAE